MLVAHDGVPIASVGRLAGEPMEREGPFALTRDDGLSALTSIWVHELGQAVAPLSWEGPQRIVLKGARGILVLRRIETAILVVLLSRGLSPEDVRLSMDGTIARIERTLRRIQRPPLPGAPLPAAGEAPVSTEEPASPLPVDDTDAAEWETAEDPTQSGQHTSGNH